MIGKEWLGRDEMAKIKNPRRESERRFEEAAKKLLWRPVNASFPRMSCRKAVTTCGSSLLKATVLGTLLLKEQAAGEGQSAPLTRIQNAVKAALRAQANAEWIPELLALVQESQEPP